MRRLLPTAAEPVDLTAEYAYPDVDRPWLRANMIASADGAAWRDGRSGGLGNAADRRLLSRLRGLADVVLVGAATARVEEYGPIKPRKGWAEFRTGRSPVPPLAIVCASLELDFDAPLFTEASAQTIVITTRGAPATRLRAAEKVADVIMAGTESVDPRVAVDELARRGHHRLLTEGGPRLLAQLAAAGLLDELCLTLSPLLLGGPAPRILNGIPTVATMRLAHVLEDDSYLYLRYTHA